jgi:periplasmic protein TonB
MSRHLNEEQVTRWFTGQPEAATAVDRQHVQECAACAREVEFFGSTLSLFQNAVRERAAGMVALPPTMTAIVQSHTSAGQVIFGNIVEPPSLLVSLKRAIADTLYPPKIETTATPIAVRPVWSNARSQFAQGLSVGLHILVVSSLLFFPAIASNFATPTISSITMLAPPPPPLRLPPTADRSRGGGGGGGGMKTPTPPSKGELPRGADKQLLPPTVEIKNLAPSLIVEPTIVALQLAQVQLPVTQFGDPNGVVGPPSAGPGTGGGIGTGVGTGIGPGKGPGAGAGNGGGIGGEVFAVGGGVSEPTPTYAPTPEYSDAGRKGRIQGTVELLVVVKADGSVEIQNVSKSLGYGLDQKAIDAVKAWKFLPARKDGIPVATLVIIMVTFSLR